MDEQNIRKMVEQMVEQMINGGGTQGKSAANQTSVSHGTGAGTATAVSSECLPDITKIDLKTWFLIDHPKNKEEYLHMKSKTPARLGVGRAGARYKTMTMLRVRADHAA